MHYQSPHYRSPHYAAPHYAVVVQGVPARSHRFIAQRQSFVVNQRTHFWQVVQVVDYAGLPYVPQSAQFAVYDTKTDALTYGPQPIDASSSLVVLVPASAVADVDGFYSNRKLVITTDQGLATETDHEYNVLTMGLQYVQ